MRYCNSDRCCLVTGAAGFIGFHVARRLLELGVCVVGYDNVNDYYSVALKEARLAELRRFDGFSFVQFMAQIKNCPSRSATVWTIQSACTLRRRSQASLWRILIRIYSDCLQRGCAW